MMAPVHAAHERLLQEGREPRAFGRNPLFDGIPVEAWEMTVGGYFPAQKWLKDRKGTELPFHEIENYQRVIVALAETVQVMGDIDETMAGALPKSWPMSNRRHGGHSYVWAGRFVKLTHYPSAPFLGSAPRSCYIWLHAGSSGG